MSGKHVWIVPPGTSGAGLDEALCVGNAIMKEAEERHMKNIEQILTMSGPRGSGRTTALLQAARSINGTFIVDSERTAKRLRSNASDRDVVSVSSDLRGLAGPFIVDHLVLQQYAEEAAKARAEFDQLRAKMREIADTSVNTLRVSE